MTTRFRGLDGLRGLAALVVVIHHSLLAIPAFNGGYFEEPVSGWLPWLMTYTPLHLVWAGGEAVFVFFVLSGFVLTFPLLRAPARWASYYPSRALRLYVPVTASILLALVLVVLLPRGSLHGSRWIEAHQTQLSVGEIFRNLTLYAPSWINSPLWSLKWEVVFSVLLPVYVFVARRISRWWPLVVLGAIAGSTLGAALGIASLTYLPTFLIGSAMAAADWNSPLVLRVAASRRTVLVIAGLTGLTARWWLAWLPGAAIWTLPIVLASAALLVLVSATGSHMLTSRAPQALGCLSFSLYLVHEPIVVSLALILPSDLVGLTVVAALPLSIVVSIAFSRVAEMPAHRLARRVARLIDSGRAARAAGIEARSSGAAERGAGEH